MRRSTATVPSTSKLKGQKSKVEEQKRDWLELPYDVMPNILHRVGAFDMLQNVQKVCTSWRKICKDPVIWRVIDFSVPNAMTGQLSLRKMCKHAVDRSQGQLVDITIVDIAESELLLYVANRSSIRRLEISLCYEDPYESWTEALKKFPLLEELIIYVTDISIEAIETAGRYCPMLKTLKLNRDPLTTQGFWKPPNETSIAIGENLPELRHLELIGDEMTNTGLEVILDGCRHLESLDLRACLYIDLKGDTGKKCLENMKCLKLPNDSLEGCPYRAYLHDYDQCIRAFDRIMGDYDDDDFPNMVKQMIYYTQ